MTKERPTPKERTPGRRRFGSGIRHSGLSRPSDFDIRHSRHPVSRSGRFTEGPADSVAAFTQSVSFDRRLWRQDLLGSIAHATMLRKAGLVSKTEQVALVRGLERIGREIAA